MTEAPEPDDTFDDDTFDDDEVQHILDNCLAMEMDQWSKAVESACSEHPEHADELQLSFNALRSTGLDAVYTMDVASGQATYRLTIPSQANLIGFQVFAQSSVFAPTYNSFGFINSNGVALTLGN